MIEGNDGGACISINGGQSWSSIYNQPTAQFYRIDIDNQYAYRVYATQQDNTSISTPSAAVWGAITLGDCTYPGTGESGFIAVHPEDSNIVYCGAIGSSPEGAAEPPSGPTVVPGQYRVEMSVGSQTMTAELSVVKGPRLSTAPDDYRRQFELLRELMASLGQLNATVNNIRRLKRRLAVLAGGSDGAADDLTPRAAAAAEQLAAVEAVLVDVRRGSPRDLLRNPAGLNDALVGLISTVSLRYCADDAGSGRGQGGHCAHRRRDRQGREARHNRNRGSQSPGTGAGGRGGERRLTSRPARLMQRQSGTEATTRSRRQ
jgi:hypothetical protein